MIIDSHCHLNHEQLRGELDEIIQRATDTGIDQMVVIGYDLPSSIEAAEIAERHGPVYAAVGVHPHDSRHYDSVSEDRLRELTNCPKVVAVGEIGLDYHYDFSPREAQFRAFRSQLALARDCRLPVIVHCREAYRDVLDLLEQERATDIGGVMHCWAGTMEEAERTLSLGFYLGFGGVLTFKSAEENRRIAAGVPLDRLLLETDAPYLAPVPHRGKRNEPAYTRLVAEKLAELREIPVKTLGHITSGNCRRLFRRLEQ